MFFGWTEQLGTRGNRNLLRHRGLGSEVLRWIRNHGALAASLPPAEAAGSPSWVGGRRRWAAAVVVVGALRK